MGTNLFKRAASNRRQFMVGSAALAGSAMFPVLGRAQEQLRQATILVGSPPGGATDKLARLYADSLTSRYARSVIVENKPGAGGSIAYGYVKNSAVTDGSLMFLSPAYPIVISPHVVPNLPYDPIQDFVPIAPAGRSMMTFCVGPAVPAEIDTLDEYLKWCRENPDKAMYAAQTGSSQHLVGTSLALATGVPLSNVSYKGDAPAVQDTLGGHVPAIILPIASAIPQYKAKQLRVLAVTGANRSRFLPDVPTVRELGYEDILFQDWLGFFTHADTPAATVRQMNATINEVIKSEKGGNALTTLGFEPVVVTADVFAEMVKSDHQRYAKIIERTKFNQVFQKAIGS